MFKKILIFFIVCLIFPNPAFGQDASPVLNDLNSKIEEYQKKLDDIGKQKDTLANQLKYIDFQSNLTELKINQTEDSIKTTQTEIASLLVQINNLEASINHLTEIINQQTAQGYKLEKRIPKLSALLGNNFNDFLNQLKYLVTVQENNQNNIIKMKTAKTDFSAQKAEKEKKQLELENLEKRLAAQKDDLIKQKQQKDGLLTVTKNDEAKYKSLKEAAESELNSLVTAAFVGKRSVKKGDILGLMGNTGYSFGDHLHFGLYNLKESEIASWTYANDIDPLEYLSKYQWPMSGLDIPTDINKECQADYKMASLPNGPLNPKLGSITQCRGQTRYSYAMYSNHFHNGIDMFSNLKTIYAVNDGIAYFFRNPKSSLGNHVKLFHPDGKMTLYLHMQ